MTTDDQQAQIRAWRHHLHRQPEVGFAENDTGEFVAGVLEGLGIDVVRGVGGTGVVGTLTRGSSSRTIGLRADMDALALQEVATHEYRSTRDGVMHACGHDGHMAMLLGAAASLATDSATDGATTTATDSATDGANDAPSGGGVPGGGAPQGGAFDGCSFDGTVRFVFQPAEEHGQGALAMLADGLLERFPMDAMYGLHNIPGIPANHLHTRPGAIMASEDNFTIAVHGRGGHASRPQAVIDPLLVAAQIVVALQSIVARSVDPIETAVVSCTEIHGDGARNAIPSNVVISGDTRSFSPEVQRLLGVRIREIADGICAAYGATCEVTYTNSFRPTVNDPTCTEAAVAAAVTTVGAQRVDGNCAPIMASEDFAVFADEVPACFTFLGNGTEGSRGGAPLHSRDYDFNDEVLGVGVNFYVNLVRQLLPGGAGR